MLKRISLLAITRNPDQPRQHFDQRALEELADSISINGLKQPITVRPIPETEDGATYMVVMGERRYRAHQILMQRGELDTILCHVRKMDEETMHIDAILENLQREEVSPIEEAVAYQRAIEDLGLTVTELGRRLGISQLWRITDRLALLGLTEDNRDLVTKGVVTLTQAFHMAGLSSNGQQTFLGMVRQGLVGTNKAAEAAAAAIKAKEDQIGFDMPEPPAPKARRSAKPIEDRIDALGTALAPLLKDGRFEAPDDLDPAQVLKCIQKLRALKSTVTQIERELTRAASVAAAS